MNYDQLYRRFIHYCQTTTVRSRLVSRNKTDFRISKQNIYTEIHHIVPRSIGGTNDMHNLVVLLPEEHLFAHKLRYKAYNCRQDVLAVRFMLNGLKGNKQCRGDISHLRITKSIKVGYAWIKTNSAEFRKKHGWQTAEGRKKISEARTGKIVVRDIDTRCIVGSVSNTHPNVLSGQWIHHLTGRVYSEAERKNRSICSTGILNNNYSSITDQQILDLLKQYIDNGEFISIRQFQRDIVSEHNYPHFGSAFRFSEYINTGNLPKIAYAFCDSFTGYDITIFKHKKNTKIKVKSIDIKN